LIRTIFQRVILLIILTAVSYGQIDGQKWKKWNLTYGQGNGEISLVTLSNPSRWTDTTEIPLTPYTDGYAYFHGNGKMLHTSVVPFFNTYWNFTDSFRIVIEVAHSNKLAEYVVGNWNPVLPQWMIVYHSNHANAYSFQMAGKTETLVMPSVNADTSFRLLEIRWSKQDSILRVWNDGDSAYAYTGWVFTSSSTSFSYGTLCIGNRAEQNNTGQYVIHLANTDAYTFKGRIKSFLFSKNDTIASYNLSPGNSQNIVPDMYIGGDQIYPYYPSESADRFVGAGDLGQPGMLLLNNGAGHGIDTMDAVFTYGDFKDNYRDCFVDYGSISGFDAGVWAEPYGGQFTILNNELYACGDFSSANSLSPLESNHDSAKGVVKWTGTEWEQVGHGFDGDGGFAGIQYLFSYGDTLIAAGYQTTAIGVGAVGYVAQFKGTNWEAMGTGFNNVGFCGAEAYGKAWVGGFFTQADGKSIRRIAVWDGVKWDSLKGGLNANLTDITPYVWNGEQGLLLGGYFTEARQGGVTLECDGLVFWSVDSSKYKIFAGLQCTSGKAVYKILEHDGWLYFVGDFDQLGDATSKGIARWKNGEIENVGSGIYGYYATAITSAVILDDILYVGGMFSRFNNMLSPMFAAVNLTTGEVIDVGYGLDMRVEDLKVFNNEVMIIGDGFHANGQRHFIVTAYDPALNIP